jgi:hypothetical protein
MGKRSIRWAIVAVLALASGCGDPPPEQEGGREQQRPDAIPDRGVLSPLIIVPPLLDCGESVTVKGFVSTARIRVYIDGNPTPSADETGRDPEGQTLHLGTPLHAGQSVVATQEYDGTEGPPSAPVIVVTVIEAYPRGLPKPNLPFQPLFDCGIATYADNLPQGGKVRVFDQANVGAPTTTIGGVDGVAAGQSIGIGPAFIRNHLVTAQSQICDVMSPVSDPLTVMPAPATLPPPQTTGIYENGQIITVNQLVNGAKVTISKGGMVIGGGGAPGDHVRFWLSSPVGAGETLGIMQEMCGVPSTTTTVDVQPCSALPAPRISAPWAGDEIIYVIDPVPGSRIRVYAGSSEIGDGGGSEIKLIRPLVDGEELFVTQSIGNCIARNAWRVRVGRGLDDPTASGPCSEPARFEYGHQQDPDRRSVDVTGYFNSPDASVGIPMNAVPLHGVVRHPRGSGPYPLVLIVHGNHSPTQPSYPGYDYLLDLLASHCMIAVSIEEDFLNGNVGGEMDSRGIVLLRHLQLWREWNQTPGHAFFGKVDMNRLGLSGHSRGGEAIVAAHLLNVRDHNSLIAAQNFGFNIRSLYAIAPVDGQFDSGAITLPGGADYYVMHGSHDGDVHNFGGQRMYNRAYPVSSSTANTKGFLFLYGANHGQWNSTWETCCEQAITPAPSRISGPDQKQIGKAYMNAFFRMSLKNEQAYKHFLNGDATFATLSSAITRVFQYQDPHRTFINHYEEDNNPATASLAGAGNSTSGTLVRHENPAFSGEGPPDFLWGQSRGLMIGWGSSANPEYRIALPSPMPATLPNYRFLAFHAGQTHEDPSRLNSPTANQDFSVQLHFGGTAGPEVHVSSYALLRYPMVTGPRILSSGPVPNTKSIQRTVRIPFADLRAAPRLTPRDVTQIVFKFNQRTSGNIAIDEIQFTD